MDILNFRVAPDMGSLELWVEVPDGYNYEDIEIEKIAIIDYSRFKDDNTYPATTFKLEFTRKKQPPELIFFEITNPKRFVRRIPLNDPATKMLLGTDKAGIYYVYIQVKGIPDEEVACCCFKSLTVGCAVNHFPVYNLLLKAVCAYEDRCNKAEDKILDIYLKKQLITQAVETSDYIMANQIFAELYKREIDKGFCLDGCGSFKSKSNAGAVRNIQGSGCTTCG
jgi:hypothetical protein